jgi:hypothetical protein
MPRRNVLAVVTFALSLTGCSTDGDPSLATDRHRAPSDKVENGTAYDRAIVDPGSAKRIVLPDTATVRRTVDGSSVRLFMAKRLAFAGHPPEPMGLRDARTNMGCATKVEGNGLVIATFGEWSNIEGGADVKLVAEVPGGLTVEQREGLSGVASAARGWQGVKVTKPADAKSGYWYGPTTPAPGWSAVPDEPDPDRTAK